MAKFKSSPNDLEKKVEKTSLPDKVEKTSLPDKVEKTSLFKKLIINHPIRTFAGLVALVGACYGLANFSDKMFFSKGSPYYIVEKKDFDKNGKKDFFVRGLYGNSNVYYTFRNKKGIQYTISYSDLRPILSKESKAKYDKILNDLRSKYNK
jgi:hypothetical protein